MFIGNPLIKYKKVKIKQLIKSMKLTRVARSPRDKKNLLRSETCRHQCMNSRLNKRVDINWVALESWLRFTKFLPEIQTDNLIVDSFKVEIS